MDNSISPMPMPITPQAGSDDQLIALWLHGRSDHTKRAYRADIDRFLSFVGVALPVVGLSDLQRFADSIGNLAPSTQKRMLSSIKSLITFGQKVGYLMFNVGAALKIPKEKDTIAERILSKSQIHAIIILEPDHRKQVLLRLLYASGGRVSEICNLRWKDAKEHEEGGQVTLYGKGGKTRAVRLYADTWRELLSLRKSANDNTPIFATRTGRALIPFQVGRIVKAAARRAGISGNVSPHWFRHSHATHALDNGAPIHLVQATLGHSSVAITGRYLHANPKESSAKYLDM